MQKGCPLLPWTVNRRKMGQTVPGVGNKLIFMLTLKHFTICSEKTQWHSEGDKSMENLKPRERKETMFRGQACLMLPTNALSNEQ